MSEEKAKTSYLSRNIILFGISSVGTKLITFLLVPLYTNCLTKTEYGIIDLIGTIINLAVPVLSLSLDSVIDVFCLDKNYDSQEVISSGTKIWFRALLLNIPVGIASCMIAPVENRMLFLFGYLVIFISQGTSGVMSSIYRGIERVEVNVITSLVYTGVLCLLNILFLAVFKLGMMGYYLSIGISGLLSVLIGLLMIKIRTLSLGKKNKSVSKKMQAYGAPLIFNQIGWWINTSLDKYVIIHFLGMGESGVYSIAYKIPSILSVFSGIFSSAWSMSAIKNHQTDGASEFASHMYSVYNSFITIVCALLLVANIPLAKLLYAKEFFVAWEVSGMLVFATVFNGLSGFLGSFFAAAKDSKSYATSTIIGGVINLAISVLLIGKIGYKGVAVGTIVSYIFIWLIRFILCRKYIDLKVNWFKCIFTYILLAGECVIGMNGIDLQIVLSQILITLVIAVVNFKDLKEVFMYFLNKLLGRIRKDGKVSD